MSSGGYQEYRGKDSQNMSPRPYLSGSGRKESAAQGSKPSVSQGKPSKKYPQQPGPAGLGSNTKDASPGEGVSDVKGKQKDNRVPEAGEIVSQAKGTQSLVSRPADDPRLLAWKDRPDLPPLTEQERKKVEFRNERIARSYTTEAWRKRAPERFVREGAPEFEIERNERVRSEQYTDDPKIICAQEEVTESNETAARERKSQGVATRDGACKPADRLHDH